MPQIGIALSDEERLKKLKGAPLSPMQTPAPRAIQREKGAGEQMLDLASNSVMNKASEKYLEPMVNKGFEKAAGLFTTSAAPTAAQFAGLKAAAPLATGAATGAGVAPGMAQAILGSGSAAAPLVAKTAGMTGAGLAGTTAGGIGTAAATGAAGAAGTGAMAAMMASPLAPIAIGLLAGKALKLFSEGGHVGPLYSAEGSKVSTTQAILDNIAKQKKKKESYENKSVLDALAGSNLVDYKANGGMTGFRSEAPASPPPPTTPRVINSGLQQTKKMSVPVYVPAPAPLATTSGKSYSKYRTGDDFESYSYDNFGDRGD